MLRKMAQGRQTLGLEMAVVGHLLLLRRQIGLERLDPGLIALFVAMQSGNLAHMGNIAGMGRTSTRWWVRLEQGRSHNQVLCNRVLHSREQSLKPPQATRAQDPGQERLRLPRSSLRHATLLRIHNPLYSDIEHLMVQQTTLATLLR
jgi:hypothetical protein